MGKTINYIQTYLYQFQVISLKRIKSLMLKWSESLFILFQCIRLIIENNFCIFILISINSLHILCFLDISLFSTVIMISNKFIYLDFLNNSSISLLLTSSTLSSRILHSFDSTLLKFVFSHWPDFGVVKSCRVIQVII